MRKLALSFIALCGALIAWQLSAVDMPHFKNPLVSPARAQLPFLLRDPLPVATVAPFALDGSTTAHSTSSTNTITGVSTAFANDIIVLLDVNNISSNVSTISSISDTAGLTWTQLGAFTYDSVNGDEANIYYAKSSGILSSDTVTVNYCGGCGLGNFGTTTVLGISGAHFASPLDSNASNPGSATNGTASSMTTSNANDFLVEVASTGCQSPGSLGAWTAVSASAANCMISAYQIVSASGSQTTNWGSATPRANMIGAFIKGP